MIPLALLASGLAAAWTAITALHLRSRPRGGARPFPSFQHLVGLAPKRRPAWPLEEPLRWLLRVASLGLVAAALLLARREARRPFIVLVEPGTGRWDEARSLVERAAGPAVALSFDGEKPIVVTTPRAVEAAERARRALSSCSATPLACLARAAGELDGETLVVASFSDPAEALEPLGSFRSFQYLRAARAAASEPAPAKATPAGPAEPRVRRLGTSPAARIWAAALEAASAELGEGAEISVADTADTADPAAPGASGSGLRLVPVTAPGPLARLVAVGGVPLDGEAALAAGTRALDLGSSLALVEEAAEVKLRPLVTPVLARDGDTFRVAASEEDLGRWAHGATLLALARIVLHDAGRVVTTRTPAPSGPAPAWRGGAPVGLTDVAPGRYEREDGRAVAVVERARTGGATPLADATLAALGGKKVDTLPAPSTPSRLPFALLLAALLLRLADAWPGKLRPLAVVAYGGTLALLALLLVDGSRLTARDVRRAVSAPAGLKLPGLDVVPDESCALPGAARPCAVVARAAPPGLGNRVNAIVFAADRPRVDLVSWELPAEIRTGEAGLLRATLDVRRAAGRDVTLAVRPTSGVPAETTRRVGAAREIVTLTVPVRPTAEGISFALVTAQVRGPGGQDGVEDAVVVPVAARTRPARRLILAAAPGWEARAAGEALAARGEVERWTRLGVRAVLTRGVGSEAPADPPDPLARLAADLSAVDSIVLVGFTREDLAGKPEALVARYVEGGGALLFLGEPPRLEALPLPVVSRSGAEESVLPSRVAGTLAGREASFLGFGAWKTSLPLAGAVLGRLDGRPWAVGRALGKGRVAALTAPDLWRTGPAYTALLGDLVGWLEAGHGGGGAIVSPDLRTLAVGEARATLPATALAGLPVDPVDPFRLLPPGRGKQRVEAARARAPFLEADTPADLAALLVRVPPPDPLPRRVFARDASAVWLALAALLVLEVAIRRRA